MMNPKKKDPILGDARLFCIDTKTKSPTLFPSNFFYSVRPGTEGFEPPNTGTKTRCLTTWRRPISISIRYK